MGLTGFQGDVVNALNTQDTRNQDLLDQVVTAANEASSNTANNTDVTVNTDDHVHTAGEGTIVWGGKEASIQGTGGVALLEYAKDAISTAVSNITGVGTSQIQNKKVAERKMSQA